MVIDNLAPALRLAFCHTQFAEALAQHAAGLASLAEVPDAPSLLARLDGARPYGKERDAMLADLLRLHRRCRESSALDALLYAVHQSVARRCFRLTSERYEARERVAEFFHALTVRLDAYDPDHRSPHVQANLERDTFHMLWYARREERRHRGVQAALDALVGRATDTVLDGTHVLADLIERREISTTSTWDPTDIAAATAALERLAARRLLSPRDVVLLLRVEVQGHRVADVARDLAMSLAATKKALVRARRMLRDRRPLVESICMSHLVALPTLC